MAKHKKTILCEQFFSCSPIKDIIEVSFIHINEKIIYFKRIFEGEPLEVGGSVPESIESNLQLFSYNLSENKEEIVLGESLVQIDNTNDKFKGMVQLLKTKSLKTNLTIVSGFISKENLNRFKKYIVTFSDRFGHDFIE